MGTLVAVYGYFRREIVGPAAGRLGTTPSCSKSAAARPAGWAGCSSSAPSRPGWSGLVLKKWLKAHFYNLPAMGVVAIVFALLMLAGRVVGPAAGRAGARGPHRRAPTPCWVGGWQALALMPGASRSGATITGGLFAGLSRETATRFSFLLSLPVITAAGLKELYDEWKKLTARTGAGRAGQPVRGSADQLVPLLAGTAVAAVVGYLAIAGLLAFLRRYSTGVFVGLPASALGWPLS